MQSAFSCMVGGGGGGEIAIGCACMPGHAYAGSVDWWRKVQNRAHIIGHGFVPWSQKCFLEPI